MGQLQVSWLHHCVVINCWITAVQDYTTVSQTATFAAGEATTTISIPMTDDSIPLEPDESFILSLIPNPNVIVIQNGSVTIDDGDYVC